MSGRFDMDRPRILFITREAPWPATNGGALRRRATIAALAHVADVDLVVLDRHAGPPDDEITTLVQDTTLVPWPRRRRTLGQTTAWALRRQPPSNLTGYDFLELRRALSGRSAAAYDMTWMSHAEVWLAAGGHFGEHLIVDLSDLEFMKFRQLADLSAGTGLGSHVRRLRYRLLASEWERLQHRVARDADRVLVCSDEDARRLDVENSYVLPNSYPRPEPDIDITPGDRSGRIPPSIVFVGAMEYGPNADGIIWYLEEVHPLVEARRPDVVLDLVGRVGRRVLPHTDRASVRVHGVVESTSQLLAEARAFIVPIRYGSGTRIKILEAFAHRIPVVTTSLGCEGLRATDGEHVRIGDTPRSFADACLDLLGRPDASKTMVANARALYERRYSPTAFEAAIRTLLGQVLDRPHDPTSSDQWTQPP